MKRTDADGAVEISAGVSGFTDGNPSLSVAATVLESTWCNNVQEEIVQVILDAGITLNGNDYTQLLTAIKKIITSGTTKTDFTIDNNQTSAADVTGLLFDKTAVKSAKVSFDIYRNTDTVNANEQGELRCMYDPNSDTWSIQSTSYFDDSEVTFSITSAGQVQYVSSNMAGGSYTGTMRFNDIKTIAIV